MTRTIPVSGRFSAAASGRSMTPCCACCAPSTEALSPGKLPNGLAEGSARRMMNEELLDLGLLKPRDVKKQDPD